jgi:hypothetical protein
MASRARISRRAALAQGRTGLGRLKPVDRVVDFHEVLGPPANEKHLPTQKFRDLRVAQVPTAGWKLDRPGNEAILSACDIDRRLFGRSRALIDGMLLDRVAARLRSFVGGSLVKLSNFCRNPRRSGTCLDD